MSSDSERQSTNATNPRRHLPPAGSVPPMAGFLDLSAELRNNIYHVALTSEQPLRVRLSYCKDGPLDRPYEMCKAGEQFDYGEPEEMDRPNASFLRTCRQINQEATAVFYGSNAFHIPVTEVWYPSAKSVTINQSIIGPFSGVTIERVHHLILGGSIYRGPFDQGKELEMALTALIDHAKSLVLKKISLVKTNGRVASYFFPRIAKKLLPFIDAIREARGIDLDKALKLVDIVSGVGFDDDSVEVKRDPEEESKKAQELTRRVHEEIRLLCNGGGDGEEKDQ